MNNGKPRFAVLLTFFINGAILASFVSRIPATQSRLGLSEAALGLVLVGLSAGVLAALSVVGGWISRFGSRRVTGIGAVVLSLCLILIPLTTNPVALWAVLFIFGGALSSMDVAMNEQAIFVERRAGRPMMSSFHAGFSLGGLSGALIGAGMAALPTMTPLYHFIVMALASTAVMALAYPQLIRAETKPKEKDRSFQLPDRALWLLGAVAFCSAIGEGAMGGLERCVSRPCF